MAENYLLFRILQGRNIVSALPAGVDPSTHADLLATFFATSPMAAVNTQPKADNVKATEESAEISPCFMHHIRHVGRAKPGDPIRGHTLSALFAEARDLTGIQWPQEKTPPSFHELRSLSARLYADQGINAQALLGHKSADMTAIYRDTRGAEWIEVKTA